MLDLLLAEFVQAQSLFFYGFLVLSASSIGYLDVPLPHFSELGHLFHYCSFGLPHYDLSLFRLCCFGDKVAFGIKVGSALLPNCFSDFVKIIFDLAAPSFIGIELYAFQSPLK